MFANDRVTDSTSSLWDGCGPEHRWLIVYDVVSHQSVCSIYRTCVRVNSKKFKSKHSLGGNKFTVTEIIIAQVRKLISSKGTWQAKHPFKCLFKAGGLLGMVPVSSTNAWGSGSGNRGSWHFLTAKVFSFQGWAEVSSGPCSDLPHTAAIPNNLVLFFSWKQRKIVCSLFFCWRLAFLTRLSPQLPFRSSAEIWIVVFVLGPIYSLCSKLTLPYSPCTSIRHN